MCDAKLKTPALDALTAISEAVGPQFVAQQLHKKAVAHKNPKVPSTPCPPTCYPLRLLCNPNRDQYETHCVSLQLFFWALLLTAIKAN